MKSSFITRKERIAHKEATDMKIMLGCLFQPVTVRLDLSALTSLNGCPLLINDTMKFSFLEGKITQLLRESPVLSEGRGLILSNHVGEALNHL